MLTSHEERKTISQIDIDLTQAIEEASQKKKKCKDITVITPYTTINDNVKKKITNLYYSFGWELKLYHNTWRLRPVS